MNSPNRLALLLDSGNSRLKCRCIYADNAVFHSQFSVDNAHLPDLLAWLQQLSGTVVRISAVAVTSSEIKETIEQMLQQGLTDSQATSVPVQWYSSREQSTGLRNGYKNRDQLGNDRWFGMMGVVSHAQPYQKPLLYVSMGTASTVDTIVGDDFVGGLILPGIGLMQTSLKQGTAQLPLVAISVDTQVDYFPRDTQMAMVSGIVAAQVGAIARQCLIVYQTYGQMPDVYVGGGARSGILLELKRTLQGMVSLRRQPSQKQEGVAVYEIEAPVLDGLHYHYAKCYSGE